VMQEERDLMQEEKPSKEEEEEETAPSSSTLGKRKTKGASEKTELRGLEGKQERPLKSPPKRTKSETKAEKEEEEEEEEEEKVDISALGKEAQSLYTLLKPKKSKRGRTQKTALSTTLMDRLVKLVYTNFLNLVGSKETGPEQETDKDARVMMEENRTRQNENWAASRNKDISEKTGPGEQNCSAVYVKNKTYWVAFNSNELIAASNYFGENYTHKIVNVPTILDKMHAEMKILQKFKGQLKGKYIGIMQLCCLPCAAALTVSGVNYRGCHFNVYSAGWELPEYILSNDDLLAAFFGPDAWAVYSVLGPGDQELFISHFQNFLYKAKSVGKKGGARGSASGGRGRGRGRKR